MSSMDSYGWPYKQVGKVDEAFRTFQQLHEVDPSTASSAAVVGQLASAALNHDPSAAQNLEQRLESLPEMSAEEVGKLEAAGEGHCLFLPGLLLCG